MPQAARARLRADRCFPSFLRTPRRPLSKLETIDRIAAAVKAGKSIVDIIVSLLQKAFAIRL